MTRDELFDKVLQRLYDKKDYFVSIPEYIEEITGTDNYQISGSICKELIEKNWATPSNYHQQTMQITYNGQQIIEEYGSYSSYLKSLSESFQSFHNKNKKQKIIKAIPKLIGTAGILWGALFTYLDYDKGQKIKEKDQTISRQQTTTDSLRQILDRQQKTIDNLTVSKQTDTTIKNKYRRGYYC